jgi:hypothetical protein
MVSSDFAQFVMTSISTQKLENKVYSCLEVKYNQKFKQVVYYMNNISSLISY